MGWLSWLIFTYISNLADYVSVSGAAKMYGKILPPTVPFVEKVDAEVENSAPNSYKAGLTFQTYTKGTDYFY